MPNEKRVLLIDDDKRLLAAATRSFRKAFKIEVANSSDVAYEMLLRDSNFSVVICDQNMPGQIGSECLSRLSEMYPNITRIMLTGNNDLGTAVKAVNDGSVYRFLSKPIKFDQLIAAIDEAHEFHIATANSVEILDQTLCGSLRMLTDILAFNHPQAAFHAQRVRQWVNAISSEVGFKNTWEIDIALSIAPLAWLFAGRSHTASQGLPLNAETCNSVKELTSHVPRMENLSAILGQMEVALRSLTGEGFLENVRFARCGFLLAWLNTVSYRLGPDVVTRSTVTNAAQDLCLQQEYRQLASAIEEALVCFVEHGSSTGVFETLNVSLQGVRAGDTLLEDVFAPDGTLLLSRNHALTSAMAERLKSFSHLMNKSDKCVRVSVMRSHDLVAA